MKTVSPDDLKLVSREAHKDYFRIPLLELIDGSRIYLPCALIGKGKGPILTVVSGQHGNEWTGTYASQLLYNNLNPENMKGTIVLLPIANPPAFRQKRRVSNLDFVDMNRVFRFVKDNKPTDKIAKFVFNEFCLKSTAVLDLHGGGPGEYIPIAEVMSEDDIEFGLCLNLGNVIVLKKDVGALVTNCKLKGIKAISIEAGKELSIDENNASNIANGITNLMACIGMLRQRPGTNKNQQVFRRKVVVSAERTGFFTGCVKLGQSLSKEQKIGKIQPFFRSRTSTVKAPDKGLLIYLRHQRIVSEGESIAHIAV